MIDPATPLDFRAIGPLTVSRAGAVVPVTRQKCRALLGLLISTHPHGISPDAIADALWPDADFDKAANSVRVHATYLRRALKPTDGLVVLTDGRYRLAVDADAIDVGRFERLVHEARHVADGGDPSGAAEIFTAAIAEWRGTPYQELGDLPTLRNETVRLESLRLDALEGFATALLDDDRPDQVCRLLEPIIEDHLIRETLAARLMLALYRSGRQQDALGVFGAVKRALADGLGLVPGNQLQGLADMIVMHDAELEHGDSSPTPRIPHPPRRRAEFIGRAAELQTLDLTWRRAVAGTPQLAYIAGPAGIGKSTVVDQFTNRLATVGVEVVQGACDPDPVDDYQPFPDLVRSVLDVAPPTDTNPRLLGELARLTPDLADRLPPAATASEPSAGRQRLFDAVTDLLTSNRRPRLVIVEDLHWARPDTVLLFRHFVRAATGPVMVLGTYRDDERSPTTAFGNAMRSGRLGRPDAVLTLATLSRHEVVAVVDAVAPRELRSQWIEHIDELTDVSGGNPLRLREVLRQLELEPETPISEIAPDDVRALVERRLRSFDELTSHVMYAAATLGREFTIDDIAALVHQPADAVLSAVERAQASGLVEETERVDDFTFSHPLFRNAIYHDMGRSRRARNHVACARWLRERAGERGVALQWSEVARHLLASQSATDRTEISEACAHAGVEAERRYAHHEAATWFRHAVEQATERGSSEIDTALLRLELGHALEMSGDLEAGRAEYLDAANTARRLGHHELLVRAAVAANPKESVIDPGFSPVLAKLAEDALAVLAPDDPQRVPLLRGLAQAVTYHRPAALIPIAQEVRRLTEGGADPEARYTVFVIEYLAAMSEPVADRLALSYEARDYTRRHRLGSEEGTATRRLLCELFVVGAPEAISEELDELGRLARATSTPLDLYWTAALRATRSLMREPSAITEELINAAALLGRRLQIFTSTGTQMLQTFALRYQQGRSRELTNGLTAPDPSAPQILAGSSLLALAMSDAGRFEEARRVLDLVIDDGAITLPRDNFRNAAIGLFSGVAADCGSPSQRAVLRENLEPVASEFCVFGAGGAVFGTNHHWLGRLAAADGDATAAAEHFHEAERLCHRAGATFWADRARQDAASMQ